jgi:oligosaccharide repeat unit polymerase
MSGKWVALFFSLLILANGYVVRRIVGTWLFPASIFALAWFAYTFLPLAVLLREPVNPLATGYIFLMSLMFSSSALIYFQWGAAFGLNRRKPDPSMYFNTPFFRLLFYASSILSLVCFAINMRAQGFSLADMFFNSIETAAMYAAGRNANELSFSVAAKIGLALAYLAVTTGGLLFGCSTSRRQSALTLAGSFMPAIAEMLLESAKGLLFQFISLFFACILITRLFQGRLFLIDSAGFRKGLVALAVIVPMTLISFLSRGLYGVEDSSLIAAALPSYLASYAFGHMYSFSDWFSFRLGMSSSIPYPTEQTGFGFYTFTSIFKTLGSSRTVPPGIFDDYFTQGRFITTNVFTMYRGLIIDFGVTGGLLFTFVSGFFIHLSYYFLLVRRRPVSSVVVFIYVIGYFYSSAFASLFTWNVIPLSIVILSICLYLNKQSISGQYQKIVKQVEPA